MSTVTSMGALLGGQTDADATGRRTRGTGALFGDALVAAGRMLDGARGETRGFLAVPGAGDADAVPTEQSASIGARDDDASTAVMAQLAAELGSVVASVRAADADAAPVGDPTDTVGSASPDAEAAAAAPTQPQSATATMTSAVVTEQMSGASPDAATAIEHGATPAAAQTEKTATPSTPTATPSAPAASQPPAVTPTQPVSPDTSSAEVPLVGVGSAQAAPSSSGAASDDSPPRGDSGDRASAVQPPATSSTAPAQPLASAVAPADAPDAAATVQRGVAAQVSPTVVSIAQRPAGAHQLTMTVNPDSLGPVTVRAQISASGEVQVELTGATDAGRDALRTILLDLRRDLAAVMPHATLSVSPGSGADQAGDRGGHAGTGAHADQGRADRDAGRGRPDPRPGAERGAETPRTIQTTPHAVIGGGLDIFA